MLYRAPWVKANVYRETEKLESPREGSCPGFLLSASYSKPPHQAISHPLGFKSALLMNHSRTIKFVHSKYTVQ